MNEQHQYPNPHKEGAIRDLLDRLLAHDSWTSRQLLVACQGLPADKFGQVFGIDHQLLRRTLISRNS